jgi:parvulin-like peptidyl-prolyl isomerase
MSAAEMIKETAFVKPGDDVPNIGISPQFEEGIAPLETVGDVGEKTPIQNGFAVPVLVDKKEPRDAEFDEVKAQIVDIVKADKARAQVEEIAKSIASGATDAASLSGLASAKGLAAKDQKNFVLGSPLGEGPSAGTNETLEDAIYALKVGEAAKTPFKVGDNWYVVGVTKREDASTADFAKQRSTLMEQMLQTKRGAVFGEYLTAIRQRYEKDGSIKIYKDVVAKIDATDAGGLPIEDEEN